MNEEKQEKNLNFNKKTLSDLDSVFLLNHRGAIIRRNSKTYSQKSDAKSKKA